VLVGFESWKAQVAADGAAHPTLTLSLCVAVAAKQDTNWHYGSSLATMCQTKHATNIASGLFPKLGAI